MFFKSKSPTLPDAAGALPGRMTEMAVTAPHFVNGAPLKGPYPEGLETIYFGMGCFWGAEQLFWQVDGVHVTAVGYQGGHSPNPTYGEVCSGGTGHTESVMVVFDPKRVRLDQLLKLFWESHDPTQGMAQGNDHGTQYRSTIYTCSETQVLEVGASKDMFAKALEAKGLGPITTEIRAAGPFYFAENEHQQYLAKNPGGYCGLSGTGVTCPVGVAEVANMDH